MREWFYVAALAAAAGAMLAIGVHFADIWHHFIP